MSITMKKPALDNSLSLQYDEKGFSDALAPDPQNEADFHVDDNKFAFSPGQLDKLLNPKSLAALHALKGLHGLEQGLRTDLHAGLSLDETTLSGYVTIDDLQHNSTYKANLTPQSTAAPILSPQSPDFTSRFSDRIRVFGCNEIPEAKRKSFFRLLWDAYNDKIIILLTIAAVVSLSLGIYEAASGQSQVDWIEGVAVCVAIVIVVGATAGNDWQKANQFAKLNKRVRGLPLYHRGWF